MAFGAMRKRWGSDRTGRGALACGLALVAILVACGSDNPAQNAASGHGGTPDNAAGSAASSGDGVPSDGDGGEPGGKRTDSGAGDDAGLDGPQIDPGQLIATSGRHLLFSESESLQSITSNLTALDLESGALYDLNPEGHLVVFYTTSPDRQSLLFGSHNAAANNQKLVRITDDGLVPATQASGFEGRPGSAWSEEWSFDSRFVVYYRGSNVLGDGVDVVDTWTNALHGFIDPGRDVDTGGLTLSPDGYWFNYRMGEGDTRTAGIAHIIETGLEVFELPGTASVVAFSVDSARAAYTVRGAESETATLFVRDLPGEPMEVPTAVAGLNFTYTKGFLADGEHLLTSYQDPDERTQWRRTRIADGESQAFSDPNRHALTVYPTADRTLLLFRYEMAGTQQFELVHADGTGQAIPLMELPQDDTVSVIVGTIGPSRLYLTVRDAGLHIVTVDASGAAVNTQVSVDGETTYDCINRHEPGGPADKAIYKDSATQGLVLLDLSAPVARRVTKLMPADGVRLIRCPLWSADGKSFAYTESDDTHTRIYRVSWPGAEPAQPEMLYEAEGMIVLLVLRP